MNINKKILYVGLSEIFAFTLFFNLIFTAGVYGAPLEEPSVLKGVYAWFPLDGDTRDVSYYPKSSMNSGALPAPDRFGNSNGAMYFDGKNSFIRLDIKINPNFDPQMSVAMWVKPEQQSGCLFSNEDGGRGRSITLENRPDLKGISAQAGDKGQRFGGINIPMNEWRLVIATFDADQKSASLYIKNGQIIKRTSTNAIPGKGRDTVMLGRNHKYGEAGNYFKGSIDNVVVWSRALTEKEVEDIFNNPELLNPAPRMEILNAVDKANELFKAGFYAKGAKIYCEAMDKGFHVFDFKFTDTIFKGKRDIPPRFLGEILRSNYNIIMSTEKIAKPGFLLEDTKSGARVNYMFKDVPLSKSGVQLNDIVTAIDGKPIKISQDIDEYLKTKSPGDTVTVRVNRSGASKEYSFSLVEGLSGSNTYFAVSRLIEYGMLAAYAGHPSLVMQAAMEIRRIVRKYPADLKAFFTDEAAVALEALAIALEQGADPAYERLIDYGKIKSLKSIYFTSYKEYFYPLFRDVKKLAYFLDEKDASSIKPPADMNPKKQAYINLKGEVVEPGGNIPVLNRPGNSVANPKKSSVKGTVLD